MRHRETIESYYSCLFAFMFSRMSCHLQDFLFHEEIAFLNQEQKRLDKLATKNDNVNKNYEGIEIFYAFRADSLEKEIS